MILWVWWLLLMNLICAFNLSFFFLFVCFCVWIYECGVFYGFLIVYIRGYKMPACMQLMSEMILFKIAQFLWTHTFVEAGWKISWHFIYIFPLSNQTAEWAVFNLCQMALHLVASCLNRKGGLTPVFIPVYLTGMSDGSMPCRAAPISLPLQVETLSKAEMKKPSPQCKNASPHPSTYSILSRRIVRQIACSVETR